MTLKRRLTHWKRYKVLLLMMLPGLAYILINNYLPMFGIFIAFKDMNYTKGIWGSDWVGFKNFEFLFSTSDAYTITRNTLLYNGFFIMINLILSVGLAIFINEIKHKFMKSLYQSIILLPFLISMVVVGFLAYSFLNMENGWLNRTLLPFLGMEEVSWYLEPEHWPYILTLVQIWKNVGYLCVIYLAAIIGIDQEMYEAATIDGASKWRQIMSITIPSIQPVIIMMTLLQIGRIFYSDFGLFYQVPLNSGSLHSTTDVVDTYVYRSLVTLGDTGMSSAAGLYQAVVGFVLVIAANAVVRKFSKENALF